MDASHGVLAILGLAGGLWLRGNPERTDPGVCQCHCACATPEARGVFEGVGVWIVLILVIVLIGTNLALFLRVTVKRGEAGEQEWTFSVKGKSAGKGVFGSPKGLQILDR